jgi:hypothetical protein
MQSVINLVGLLSGLITLSGVVIAFFRWYLRIHPTPVFVLILACFAAVLGGVLWNVLCRVIGWPYHMGGSGNEPHGFHAFVWGLLTLGPIVVLSLLIIRKPQLPDWLSLLKLLATNDSLLIVTYGVLGGFAAVLFYDSGLRKMIESAHLSYPLQELIIVVLWSAVLSSAAYLSFPVVWLITRNIKTIFSPLIQVPLAIGLSFFSVLVFLCFAAYTPMFDQLRGLFAGFALRLGLFCGLIAAPHLSNFVLSVLIRNQ